MTSNAYIVRAGDTLGSIAKAHGTSPANIQAANPIIKDRDKIQAGWKLSIPGEAMSASAPTSKPQATPAKLAASLPPAKHAGDSSSAAVKSAPPCADELVDVVHFTADADRLFVLTEAQAKELKTEVDLVQKLMDEFHGIVSAATAVPCKKTAAHSDAACTCTGCKKADWAKKAGEVGLLRLDDRPKAVTAEPVVTEADIQGKIGELQQARDFFLTYDSFVAARSGQMHNVIEGNWRKLCEKKVAQLNAEIGTLQGQLKAQGPQSGETFAGGGKPDSNSTYTSKRTFEAGAGRQTSHYIQEVIILSRPDRRYYVRAQFWTRVKRTWAHKASARILREKPFSPAMVKDLFDDIKKAIGDSAKAGPLGKVEAKLWTIKTKEDHPLNALRCELYKFETKQADGDRYALSAEAQALRFAASASAGIKSFNPAKGEIDVGVKCEAAFALAEGKITTTTYFPSRAGSTLQISYRNAVGKPVRHSFGSFRLNGSLELSCFAGAKGSLEAGVKTGKGAAEGPSGALALLGTPSIDASKAGGRLGLKAEGFAGAEAGGALSGAVEWLPPADYGKGAGNSGTLTSGNSGWSALAQVKAEGNLALGIGFEGDFGVSLHEGYFALTCKANLVFGPGAGGGFGTVVDLEKIWDLAMLVCQTLSQVEYRFLLSVKPDAFRTLSQMLYKAALEPGQTVEQVIAAGADSLLQWWQTREAGIAEAEKLTMAILAQGQIVVGGRMVNIGLLPPQTLGPMLWTLTESYVGHTHSPAQEAAIVQLLSRIRRWRHMLETLEHMSKSAKKVKATDSLERINSFLVGKQQDDFNRFLDGLALHGQPTQPAAAYAWDVRDSLRFGSDKATMLAGAMRRDNTRQA
ncbi:LysM domain-containing protein [Pseudomonas sp. 9Ag]|uniref:LysM peptidoglycan-binding domain-containing protein n=1 Tax=Pseudomonas sp. 9Ag TaxID=2653167 RepID=UPI0012F1278B|nr:LysM domain-containing protein [Pseudomonas sp. 9Ag]VXC49018.1 Peptidoglycan-binding protein [Pseudomonas sp. 9Ag]